MKSTSCAQSQLLVLLLCCSSLPLFSVHASHSSYPILHCKNEDVPRSECVADTVELGKALGYWFQPYIQKMEEAIAGGGGGRHLMDCTRFCDPTIKYFTIHAPCDCTTWRRQLLSSDDSAIDNNNNNEQQQQAYRTLFDKVTLNPLQGPIQILEAYTASMPEGKCRDVFTNAHCVVNFVTTYDATTLSIDPEDAEAQAQEEEEDYYNHNQKNSVPLDNIVEVEDAPVIDFAGGSEYQDEPHDPPDGGYIEDNEELADEAEGEHLDPVTGLPMDPTTTGTGTSDNEDSNNVDEEWADEAEGEHLDPLTGLPMDPTTGGTSP